MVTLEQIDDFAEFYEDNKGTIQEHFDEYSSYFSDSKEVDLDVPLHQQLIDGGVLHCFKILSEGTYSGYLSLTVTPSSLFKGEVEIVINHLFIKKEGRGKNVAQSVIKLIEDFLKTEGVSRYSIALPDTKGHEAFATRLGMVPSSVNYYKDLRG